MTNAIGCWVHMSVVWDKSKLSKVDKAKITALWLDIANAYGSVPRYLNDFLLSDTTESTLTQYIFLRPITIVSGINIVPRTLHPASFSI